MRRTGSFAVCWLLLLAGIVCLSFSERTSAYYQSRDSNYNVAIASGGGTPFALDGTPQGTTSGGTAALALPALSTTFTNDIVYVCGVTNGGPVTSIGSSSSLSYARRTSVVNGSSTIEFWSAKSSSALSSEVATVNTTSSAFTTFSIYAFSGSHFASPFDTNGAVPASATGNNVEISTSNANDILSGCGVSSGNSAGSGWTSLYNANFLLAQYMSVSVTQTNTGFIGSPSNPGPAVMDAIIKGP